MSLPFSRSIRSLRSDSFLVSRVGLVLTALALAALLVWFFLGKVTIYQTSNHLEFNQEGNLVAQFNVETVSQIKPGAEGKLRLNIPEGEQEKPLQVNVFRVDRDTGLVEFLLGVEAFGIEPGAGKVEGIVSVEIARVSPVQVVLRSSAGMNVQPAADQAVTDNEN